MADPNNARPSNSKPSTPKVIPSLAKKQSDVTRLGTQKLKFVPTLPARRKKEDVKAEEAPTPAPSPSARGRGRGVADRGAPRGRGRGAPGAAAVEMTASGPFAMGPTLAGRTAPRVAPRSQFTPVVPQGPGMAAKLGAGLTRTGAPTLVKEEAKKGALEREREEREKEEEEERELYSDQDEGVEIVDIEKIRTMDWMAPDALRRERETAKEAKKKKVKKDEKDVKGKGVATEDVMEIVEEGKAAEKKEEVNIANAVDLSESEEEEELENIVEDFIQPGLMQDEFDHRDRLFFFQFPHPFPSFLPPKSTSDLILPTSAQMAIDEKGKGVEGATTAENGIKKVSFAEETKPPVAAPAPTSMLPKGPPTAQVKKEPQERQKVEGMIGQLEIYQSGAVKMRMGNGIVYDVAAATQPSFLQHAVHLDPENKQLCVLGEINRRFVVMPDLEALLAGLELQEKQPEPIALDDTGLIAMDTT